ncbi:uncharacterized protein LOC134238172 [Saccostrea cucullata]|uniref:uncharacterized protein LOC134238172 n=1 Tax=Saccostrea cuccullata TaxID=36930 RepID=UPI002ED4B528
MLSPFKIPGTAQHFLECQSEECKSNCEFYCNTCRLQLCRQCRDLHLKAKKNQNHNVVLYQERTRQLLEKCKIHPSKETDMLCDECQVSLCSKCATSQEHKGHSFTDIEKIHAEKLALWQKEIDKIHEYYIPTSQYLQNEIKDDAKNIKKIINSMRESLIEDADLLRSFVETIVTGKMKQIDQIESSLLKDVEIQEDTFTKYITYLDDIVKEFNWYITNRKALSEVMTIQPIPCITKPDTPAYIARKCKIEDVAQLLGEISFHEKRTESRKLKPMKMISQADKNKEECLKNNEQAEGKQIISLSPSIAKIRKFNIHGAYGALHLSMSKGDRFWVSDWDGNLVQIDLQGGHQLEKIKTSPRSEGYHTTTMDGDLIFTDINKKVIRRMTLNNRSTSFIKTGEWKPVSLYSSNSNGDILVGMVKDKEARITRYDKTGKEIQNIQWDSKAEELYSTPYYITENLNGDVCTSDFSKQEVVVVDREGQYRFSYKGSQESAFFPKGICTDILLHILVCDYYSDSVHLIDQNGQFLSLLITRRDGLKSPCSLCVDDENNLYVGKLTKGITVYKYLQ